MNASNSIQVIDGQLRRVEHIIYSDGSQVKRAWNNPSERHAEPFKIIWVSHPKPITKSDVIEHRECELYNHYFPVQ